MKISDEEVGIIKQEYNKFKNTPSCGERQEQLKFADFARSIIIELVQKDTITNENLTALIQIFGHGSSLENVKKYIISLNFDESCSTNILNIFIKMGQTGFTGIGKAAINGLNDIQLPVVREFLHDVAVSDSEEEIREIVFNFESNEIPHVKFGIYSPWLYYLHPTICPIVAGPVKGYLKKLGWDGKNYLDAWDMLKQINQTINEVNYGFFDEFIWENSTSINYWLFIVPKNYEDGKLWVYCKKDSIAAMQYQRGSEPDNAVTTNMKLIKKMKEDDKVIVYINDNTIGGIGRISKEFYEDTSHENGFDGRFGQRIGLEWTSNNFEINFKPIKYDLEKFPKVLNIKTIHQISDSDFNKIFEYVDSGLIQRSEGITKKSTPSLESILLLKKKQIILYGPPGTGKTYQTKQQSVMTIFQDYPMLSSNQEEINQEYEILKQKSQIEFITFHPSYSYEEFVEGITIDVKASGESTERLAYKLKQGIFKQMVIRAIASALDPTQKDEELKNFSLNTMMEKYREEISTLTFNVTHPREKLGKVIEWWENKPRFVLIIDEINRGDISKIFGELITLLEADKRLGMENELTARLPYSQEEFAVPPNLFIIGTMNTADKSIALIDIALRRRFGFIEKSPDMNTVVKEHLEKNKEILEGNNVLEGLEKSVEALEKINKGICYDHSVGRDRQIGHSFLFKVQTQEDLTLVWRNEILPLLEEYYYGQYSRINQLLFRKEEDTKWINQMSGISDLSNYTELLGFLNRVIANE